MAYTILHLPDKSYLGKVWALIKPYWTVSEEKWAARGLLAAVVAINLGIVFITVLINKWNNAFFNALPLPILRGLFLTMTRPAYPADAFCASS